MHRYTMVLCFGAVAAFALPAMAGPLVGGGASRSHITCICGERFSTGAPECFVDITCADASPCDANNECPAGFLPIRDNCCDAPLRDCACAEECAECDPPGTFSGGYCDAGFPDCSPVPATTDWGLGAMGLLVVVAGTLMLNRRRRLAAHA